MARPSKLTPAVQHTICEALLNGASFVDACRRADIGPATGWEWRARGEGHDPRRPATPLYVGFAAAVRWAEAGGFADRAPASTCEHLSTDGDENAALSRDAEAEFADGFSDFTKEGEPEFSEFSESVARAREEERPHVQARPGTSTQTAERRAPFTWESERSRADRGLLAGLDEYEF